MITLKELLHSVQKESKEGLVNIDNYRWPDVDHLMEMGFEIGDDFHLVTDREPKLVVYKKKEVDENGKKKEYFYVEEEKRGTRRF